MIETKSLFDLLSPRKSLFYKGAAQRQIKKWSWYNRALWNKGRMHEENDKCKAVMFLNPASQGSAR